MHLLVLTQPGTIQPLKPVFFDGEGTRLLLPAAGFVLIFDDLPRDTDAAGGFEEQLNGCISFRRLLQLRVCCSHNQQ